jgi:mono/diheme cytochrome c family protein
MEREKIMRAAICVLTFGVACAVMHAQTPQKVNPPTAQATAGTHATQQHAGDGQRIFAQNCSRCHNPPDGFSPRISGTIVRHMRVRANLSEEDMKTLMKFFHP